MQNKVLETSRFNDFDMKKIVRPQRGIGRVGYFYEFVCNLDEHLRVANYIFSRKKELSSNVLSAIQFLKRSSADLNSCVIEDEFKAHQFKSGGDHEEEIKFCSFLYNRYSYNAYLVRSVVNYRPRVLLIGNLSHHYEQAGALLSAFLNQGLDFIGVPFSDLSNDYIKNTFDRSQSLSDYPWNLLQNKIDNFFDYFDKVIFVESDQLEESPFQHAFNETFSDELDGVKNSFMDQYQSNILMSTTISVRDAKTSALQITDQITKTDNKWIKLECSYSSYQTGATNFLSDDERIAFVYFHRLLKRYHPKLYNLGKEKNE